MATKVKPSRLQVTGTPQAGNVPVYVDEDTFQWGAGGGGGTGDVTGPASSTDGNIVLFDGTTGKVIKDSGVGLSSKLDASALSDNNYGGGWNGDTTHTPTKNALYTKIHTMDVEIGNKAADTSVVKLTGNQTIAGTKTFSTSPVVPAKSTDATNSDTAIATEAQVYKKQDKLSTQTAYTAMGTATKVPQITTNTLGQVTGITEVTITQPDISGKQDKATSGSSAPSSTPSYVGQQYVDTTNEKLYFATGTSSSSDWEEVGSGAGDVTGPASSTDGDVVLFDGATGKVIKDSGVALSSKADASDVNTKAFYLSSTSDLVNAQAAYDWYVAGKNPIIIYSDKSYIIYSKSGSYIYFASSFISSGTYQNSVTQVKKNWLSFTLSGSTVTQINLNNDYALTSYLGTNTDYSSPYTPQYDGSPATKKYVDDKSTVVAASEPANPTQGMLWYDTTNNVLKSYDGSEWHEAGGSGGGGIQLAPNSEYNIKYHWYGEEDTYKNDLSQYYTDAEGDTAYFTTED